MVSRTAWGSTTSRRVWRKPSPVDRAASHWPRSTDRIPVQKISSAKEASTRVSESQATTNPLIEIPTKGRAK